MKNLKTYSSAIALIFFSTIFLFSFSSYKKSNTVSKKIEITEGTYLGNTTCTCCGKQANKAGQDYYLSVKHMADNKISIFNLENQNREMICEIVDGKIIIDEKNSGIKGLYYSGKINVLDKNSIEIEIDVKDAAKPKYANHCIGTLKKV